MARSPQWKIYSPTNEYIGSTKYAEDAAALVGLQGAGATVKHNHKTLVWREGHEPFSAAESYDAAAEVMHRALSGEC